MELLAAAPASRWNYTVVVPNIVNRDTGRAPAPWSSFAAGAASAAECLPLIEGFMQKMKERHG
ncbi:MAG: hypothetical protein ACLUNS_02225 [Alistipes shahii]